MNCSNMSTLILQERSFSSSLYYTNFSIQTIRSMLLGLQISQPMTVAHTDETTNAINAYRISTVKRFKP
jgi:hypothetical protein